VVFFQSFDESGLCDAVYFDGSLRYSAPHKCLKTPKTRILLMGPPTTANSGRISARVQFPALRIDIDSEDPLRTLQEINKTLQAIRGIELLKEMDASEDPMVWRLGYISDELRENAAMMEFISQALRSEENAVHRRIAIDSRQVLDLNSNSCSSSLPMDKVRRRIIDMCCGHESAGAAVLHISGEVAEDERQAIVDLVRQRLPRAQMRVLFSDGAHMGKTVIEMVFFGLFEQEEPKH
jgi:hypothetical protein